jgi:hypothetical protein
VAFGTGARYCLSDDVSGGEAGVIPPACKDLREGMFKPVPEIGGESTSNQ